MSGDFDALAGKAWGASKAGRDLDARLLLAAAVTTLAPPGVRPVVVDGTAVDFWAADTTGGNLTPSRLIRASQDIDIVVGGYAGDGAKLRRAMHESGSFQRTTAGIAVESCRGWIGTTLPVLVEIIDDDLAGDPDRVATIEIDGGTLYLWGIEDTAWQYAENAWSMTSREDWTRALAIREAQELDWDYMATLPTALAPRSLVQALRERWGYEELQERV